MTKSEEFTGLIKENKGIIFKICNSYCANRNDREDLAQEIIYNLWKSYSSFNTQFKFSTWMYRVALNVAISFYRSENKFKKHDPLLDDLMIFEEESRDPGMDEINLKRLQEFINELREMDKAVILLYLDDKSHREIAEITGFTETNVATKINRIKDKLRTKFIKKEN
jgi:RNA polymerase sigma factor (sigma-70 family)